LKISLIQEVLKSPVSDVVNSLTISLLMELQKKRIRAKRGVS